MKKLLIVVTAAMIGIAANAASAVWYAADCFEYAPAGGAGYTDNYLVYYIDANQYSLEQATEDLAKGDVSFAKTYGRGPGVFNAEEYGEGTAFGDAAGYGNQETVTAYAIIFNSSESIDKATYAYLSETSSDTTGKEGQAASLEFDMSGTEDAGNWQSVPEPTSGLLLLLGVAGLALRRRRA